MIVKRLLMICCIVIFLFLSLSFLTLLMLKLILRIKHELRAVWIASVLNIDWPSKPAYPSKIKTRVY